MLQILWLAVIAGAVLLAVAFSAWIPYIVGGALAALWLVWVLVSAMSPAKPDRKCPGCGKEGLVKICRGEPGVRCELCGFRDENLHVAYLDDW